MRYPLRYLFYLTLIVAVILCCFQSKPLNNYIWRTFFSDTDHDFDPLSTEGKVTP